MNPKEYLAISDAYKKVYATEDELQEKINKGKISPAAYGHATALYKDQWKDRKIADYDDTHGRKERGKEMRKDAEVDRKRAWAMTGDEWKHAKYASGEEKGKKSIKGNIKNSYEPLTQKDQQGLSDAYRAVYDEDKKYGYDKDGNSLNPVDIEKRKRKEDDLFGAPNKKKAVKEGVAKKEIKDLQKAGKTLKGKWVAKADQLQDDKNWIQGAVKRPGAFTKKAKAHDKSVQAFAKYVDDNPNKFDTRTKRQANLAQTFASMKKEDMDEMIEILGEVLLEG